jgi:multidrug efflux pump
MNPAAVFIRRPVATILLTMGLALAGIVALFLLPVAPMPQVDFPYIVVNATLPGGSPEDVATSVATPLERHLGTIADVEEMTSQSTVGQCRITLQFGLDRDINGAARDVEAAINAARADLPASLRTNPSYRKVNYAEQPLLVIALTSNTLTRGQMYDSAATVLQQKLSQVEGVGDVQIGGGALPAVRVELNPLALFKYGIGLEDVRSSIAAANADSPKGSIDDGELHFQIYTNDQASTSDQYKSLVIAYRDKEPVRLSDVADVQDSVENVRAEGLANGKSAIIMQISRQPGANVIATADRVLKILPRLRASLPRDLDVTVVSDRTGTIRTALRDIERTLMISTSLVIMVVFLFLRNGRAALIPSVAVPVSLIGTFGVMYLLHYSLDNLSLMALTIATGFVVDDAVVVLENISRHIEDGLPRFQAALKGAREVGFTVLSMSLSLIAVFTPIMLMSGLIGKFFREFAVTLSVAILMSLMVSLTMTPMMCSRLLRPPRSGRESWLMALSETSFNRLRGFYRRTLAVTLDHGPLVMLVLLVTLCLSVYLYIVVPKSLFPEEDSGRLMGGMQADQSISFQAMRQKLRQFISIVQSDPAVAAVAGFTGGFQTNGGFVFATLKPLPERNHVATAEVLARLRRKLFVPGAVLFLTVPGEVRVGGRMSNAEYQYTLTGDDVEELRQWTNKLTEALQSIPQLADVSSDQQVKGLQTDLVVDRATAAQFGLNMAEVDATLSDAFSQRLVSTIYKALNQYHVVMEVAPQFWQSPKTLDELFVSTSGGPPSGTATTNTIAGAVISTNTVPSTATIAHLAQTNAALNAIAAIGHGGASSAASVSTYAEQMIPLSAFTSFRTGNTPLAVNHQGEFVAATISFNLPIGVSMSDAVAAINDTMNRIGVPSSIQGSFAGTARTYQQSLNAQPLLFAAAIAAIYIVLGMLYESYIHPITILSTLPSAGVGAVLAIIIARMDFSIISLIAVFLLMGIVKKNAIMMIDFALDAERNEGLSPRDAIYRACDLRFRPIMMTTMSAMLAALPLAIGGGAGSELRRPLGVAVFGGLFVSQVLTLYTTPVVYLYMERFARWVSGQRRRRPIGGTAAEVQL